MTQYKTDPNTNEVTIIRSEQNPKYLIQPNSISKAIYDMSVSSKRVTAMACSLLTLKYNKSKKIETTDDMTVEFTMPQLMKTLDISDGSSTRKGLEDAIKNVFNQEIRIWQDNGWTEVYHWFSSYKYAEDWGRVKLTFTPEIANAYIAYVKGYAKIPMIVYGNLIGKYSLRLYELCWSYHGMAGKLGQWKTPVQDVSLLRKLWEIDDSMYPVIYEFKRRILNPSMKEINNYDDSQFRITEIEDIKTGRKITGFVFHCILDEKEKSQVKEKTSKLAVSQKTPSQEDWNNVMASYR